MLVLEKKSFCFVVELSLREINDMKIVRSRDAQRNTDCFLLVATSVESIKLREND